jgi:hypothetical protein
MSTYLKARVLELNGEIRSYPTPIARCDLHLLALLEERARLVEELNSLEEQGPCSPEALWANDGGFNAA